MSYDTMDAAELRTERDHWREKACEYARQYREARLAGDWSREAGIGVALDQALVMEHHIDRMLKLGVAV